MTRLVSLVALAAILATGCPDDNDGGSSMPDAKVVVIIDGGHYDQAPTTMFDATPSAGGFGQPCGQMTPCAMGAVCITTDMDMEGFCTIPCNGQMDTTTCSAAYSGDVGVAACMLMDETGTSWSCGIACKTLPGTNEMCPTGLICLDTGICDS